jgi:predicted DNA binding protein
VRILSRADARIRGGSHSKLYSGPVRSAPEGFVRRGGRLGGPAPGRARRIGIVKKKEQSATARRVPRRVTASPVRLPSSEPGVGSYALFRVAAQLQATTWGALFSRKYPELRMELLNRMELHGGELLVELRLLGPGADRLAEEWRELPRIVELESHRESDRAYLYRVVSTTPTIHAITQRHGVLTRYPIIVQDGWSRFETFGRPEQIRGFLADLRKEIGPNRVESVYQGSASFQSLGLTPALDTVFRAALSSGYFGAPRGISVTTLARNLGRSKSTVSVALAKIQQRLADSVLQLDLATTSLAP